MSSVAPGETSRWANAQFPLVIDFEAVQWPESLQPEVARYGAQRVYEAGIKSLGYPPTWATQEYEFTAIFNALEE